MRAPESGFKPRPNSNPMRGCTTRLEEEITFSDTRILVRRVINTLPVAQQEAINLAFFSGMSQREIAAKTNTPLGTVKTRLELGLKKIYDGLKELRDEL